MHKTLAHLLWCTTVLGVAAVVFLAGGRRNSKDVPAILSFGLPASKSQVTHHSYEGRDYPQHWPLDPLDKVLISYEDSVHYAVDTPLGIAEWNTTLPSGGAVVYLGESIRPFTIALFHEIRCLNIIREILADLYEDTTALEYQRPALATHCMNYLKQMVLCRASLHLESIRSPVGSKKAVSDITHTCRDWSAVYKAAEDNREAAMRRTRSMT